MNLRKKAAIAGLALVAVSLAACSNPVGNNTGSGDSSAEPADSITIWHNTADSPAILNLYKNFEKDTGIKVELVDIPSDSFETTTQTKWSTGDRPDVLEYHPTAAAILQLNPSNLLDLSDQDFVGKSGTLYKNVASYDGKVYAAVTGFPSIFGVYYNKAALDKAGIEVPTNWAELLDSCAKLNAVGITPIYESGNSQWPTQIMPANWIADQNVDNTYGDALFANEEKINDPDGNLVKGLTAYKSLQDAGCFQKDFATGTFEKATDAVFNGTAAMTALHSDALTQFEQVGGDAQTVSDAVGFTGISSESATAWYGPSPLGSYYVPKNEDAAKQAAAVKFIQYATGDGYAQLIKDGNAFPVIEGYDDPTDITDLQKSFKTAYDNGATVGFAGNIPGWNNFTAELGKLLAGQETPQQVADNMQANVEQAAKAAGLPGW